MPSHNPNQCFINDHPSWFRPLITDQATGIIKVMESFAKKKIVSEHTTPQDQEISKKTSKSRDQQPKIWNFCFGFVSINFGKLSPVPSLMLRILQIQIMFTACAVRFAPECGTLTVAHL